MKTYTAHCENGVFTYDRIVTVDRRLKEHPFAQCGITHPSNNDGTLLFVSYETIVCEIDKDGFFHLNGVFSVTTSKQITWFLREWCKNNSHRADLCNYSFLRIFFFQLLDKICSPKLACKEFPYTTDIA